MHSTPLCALAAGASLFVAQALAQSYPVHPETTPGAWPDWYKFRAAPDKTMAKKS